MAINPDMTNYRIGPHRTHIHTRYCHLGS